MLKKLSRMSFIFGLSCLILQATINGRVKADELDPSMEDSDQYAVFLIPACPGNSCNVTNSYGVTCYYDPRGGSDGKGGCSSIADCSGGKTDDSCKACGCYKVNADNQPVDPANTDSPGGGCICVRQYVKPKS